MHPALAWAASGAMDLSGCAAGPAQVLPLPLASGVAGVALALQALLPASARQAQWPGMATLSERAQLAGLQRQGLCSPGGACRLLQAADGWLAVSLPRLDDWALLAAWLEDEFGAVTDLAPQSVVPAWLALQQALRRRACAPLVERARLMGLAAAPVEAPPHWRRQTTRWFTLEQSAAALASRKKAAPPLVIDLSSLWAGPLCTHLLQLAGARVIKLESRQRPDGARQGTPEFFDLLHAGKESVVLDFATPQGRAQLQALLRRADIVIEASRPRALRQLGIDAGQLVAEQPGLTWVSLTGYGRQAPQADWIAYGDDAGVAAGLSSVMLELTGMPLFCGDAIADPLTGWHAALVALAGWQGGGGLYALSLVEVVRHCAQFGLPATPQGLQARWHDWQRVLNEQAPALAAPVARRPAGKAHALGIDTRKIFAELAIEADRAC